MPTTDQYWEYAREAVFAASQADTDHDRRNLLELSRIWTQAALVARRSLNEKTWRRECRFRLKVKNRTPLLHPRDAGAAKRR
jgi:hypothetical protein